VPEKKKQKKQVWKIKDEWFCSTLPALCFHDVLKSIGGQLPRMQSADAHPSNTSPETNRDPEKPPVCLRPQLRRVLIREEVEEEVTIWTCKPKVVCMDCLRLPSAPKAVPAEKDPQSSGNLPDKVAAHLDAFETPASSPLRCRTPLFR
jgi:hypothetical protein